MKIDAEKKLIQIGDLKLVSIPFNSTKSKLIFMNKNSSFRGFQTSKSNDQYILLYSFYEALIQFSIQT